jgi:hypothetical protein
MACSRQAARDGQEGRAVVASVIRLAVRLSIRRLPSALHAQKRTVFLQAGGPLLNPPRTAGAPGLDFQTWETSEPGVVENENPLVEAHRLPHLPRNMFTKTSPPCSLGKSTGRSRSPAQNRDVATQRYRSDMGHQPIYVKSHASDSGEVPRSRFRIKLSEAVSTAFE